MAYSVLSSSPTSLANSTLELRQLPEQGVYADLQIHIYVQSHCKGPSISFEAVYAAKQPIQMGSYSLSRDLKQGEILDSWNARPEGGPPTTSFDYDPVACSFLVETAKER